MLLIEQEGASMACEQEQEALQQARAQLSAAQALCPPGTDPMSPEGRTCQGAIRGAQQRVIAAQNALNACENKIVLIAGQPGRVTFLRVHEAGTGFGGSGTNILDTLGGTNFLDADVIFKLESHSDLSFGFKLRDDDDLPVRRGMFDLVKAAVTDDLLIRCDYYQRAEPPPFANCEVIRVELTKPKGPTRPETITDRPEIRE
jgi:hypothetical protein